MSLYEIIRKQLRSAYLSFEQRDLAELEIIGYMVLEKAGALPYLKGKALKTIYTPGFSGDFGDGKARSSLLIGLQREEGASISIEETKDFCDIVNAVGEKIPDSSFDLTQYESHNYMALQGFILTDETIETAIRSSSIFLAAGDLSAMELEPTLLLRKKLELYKIANPRLSALVDNLIERLVIHMSDNFYPARVEEASLAMERKFPAIIALSSEERHFNQIFNNLNLKLNQLIRKGTEFHDISEEIQTSNEEFDPAYLKVALKAKSLALRLTQARDVFFNNPISQKSYDDFKQTCVAAINDSKEEFAKFRGAAKWYSDLHPVFRSLLDCLKIIGGIVAGLTVVPALITERYSEQGYVGTFFNTKTDSLKKLETFEQDLRQKDGVLDKIDKLMPSFN